MQTPVIQPPSAPPPPGPRITTQQLDRALNPGVVTKQDVQALLARRSELSNQLNSAESRRRELSRSLRNATGADRAGLEARMGVLDARMARLEADIDETGRMLAAAPAAYLARQGEANIPFGPMTASRVVDRMVPITIVFTLFVLSPIALSISRALWKRGSLPRVAASAIDSQRLERMEQAMDAIAIEVERVSEGQRFVTRLLSEGRPAAPLAAGQVSAEPLRVQSKQTTPV